MTTGAPRRADAVRNHGRIVAAAAEGFGQKGLDVSIDEIAARAGVGRATVYRSFPTRDHLVAAIACQRIRWWERLVEDALGEPDAWAAFERVLLRAAEGEVGHLALADCMTGLDGNPDVEAARASAGAALERLLARAREEGRMRADATPRDVGVLFNGIARTLTAQERSQPDVWRRYVGLIVDALKRPPGSLAGDG